MRKAYKSREPDIKFNISGGKYARRITIREEAKFNISGGKYARRITIKEEVKFNISGGNAPGGNTRTHPEHDG